MKLKNVRIVFVLVIFYLVSCDVEKQSEVFETNTKIVRLLFNKIAPPSSLESTNDSFKKGLFVASSIIESIKSEVLSNLKTEKDFKLPFSVAIPEGMEFETKEDEASFIVESFWSRIYYFITSELNKLVDEEKGEGLKLSLVNELTDLRLVICRKEHICQLQEEDSDALFISEDVLDENSFCLYSAIDRYKELHFNPRTKRVRLLFNKIAPLSSLESTNDSFKKGLFVASSIIESIKYEVLSNLKTEKDFKLPFPVAIPEGMEFETKEGEASFIVESFCSRIYYFITSELNKLVDEEKGEGLKLSLVNELTDLRLVICRKEHICQLQEEDSDALFISEDVLDENSFCLYSAIDRYKELHFNPRNGN